MTETQEQTAQSADTASGNRRRSGGLSGMLLPELQNLASSLGITSTKMRKADLIGAISAAQGGGNGSATRGGTRPSGPAGSNGSASAPPVTPPRTDDSSSFSGPAEHAADVGRDTQSDTRRSDQDRADRTSSDRTSSDRTSSNRNGTDRISSERDGSDRNGSERNASDRTGADRAPGDRNQAQRADGGQRDNQRERNNGQRNDSRQFSQRNNGNNDGQRNNNQRNDGNDGQRNNNQRNDGNNDQRDFDDDSDGGRRRGRRYRDRRGRNRTTGGSGTGGNGSGMNDVEPTVSEDDVLMPVAGILDAIEDKNSWFVRTNGYFASSDDIYVANSFIRRFNLRRGDAVTGAIRQNGAGADKREKFSPLVRLDTVNGLDPEQLKNRVEFTKLTPLYPQDRLRLETEQHVLTTRVIDLVMPIGKGQRALIASPPKAGKTMVLQAIANAIATNNPECHLMVVLIDERPEEVTDMQRSVKGEVIASTFDRRPNDHTMVAELSIERAKRLVEMGHDVVVLLDSITRLGRAYNLAAPASGRILSGGVDSTALYPPKRFLGAARNIENGGSLTILATALVETGSAGDQVIYEEFKGTGNAELKLDRKIADKRTFPAIDVDQSSTRKEEILLSPDELVVTIKLRRVLHALETQQAIDLLLDRLKKTRNNIEFLMQIAKTTPGQD